MKKARYHIGSDQTFQQAWTAMLKGYFVRRATWPDAICYGLNQDEGGHFFVMVDLSTLPNVVAERHCDNITPTDILTSDWEVTPYSCKP